MYQRKYGRGRLTRRGHGTLLIIFGLFSVNCGSEVRVDSVATVRDSAGVRIVEYQSDPSPSHSISFSDEPLWRHGHRDGDYLFQRAWTGSLQPGGGAVIGDAGNSEVVVIGADGSLRRVLASSGEGPTEVSRVMSVTVLGQDTVLVEDDGNGKFMHFADGELTRTVPTAGDFSINNALRTLGVDSLRRALMTTSAFMPGFEEDWLQGHMVALDLDNLVPDTAASFDMVPFTPREGPANPFAPRGVVTASGGSFVHGRSDVPELVWRSPSGEVGQILRWNPVRSYPTEGYWTDFEDRLRADLPRVNPGRSEAEIDAMIERSLNRYEVDYGEPLPLYLTMNGDGNGGVWLAQFVGGYTVEAIPAYDVISWDGTWLGTVDSPPRFRVLDVVGAPELRVLGVLSDDFGVESVAVFRVTMTAR